MMPDVCLPSAKENDWAEQHISLSCFSCAEQAQSLPKAGILLKAAAATVLGQSFQPKPHLPGLPGSITCLI